VNGQLQPTIEMKPGEIQRWRFVNATMQQVAHLTYRFLGEDAYAAAKGGPFPSDAGYAPAIRQIAYDGVQLAPERYNDAACGLNQEFSMAPGNRIDILVQAPAMPGKSVLAFRMLHVPPAGCPIRPSLPDLILVKLNVSGTAVSPAMNFPTAGSYPAMPVWLQWNESDPRNQISKERILKFNSDNTGRPAIDGKAFDQKPDTTQYLTLNTAEEWMLENYWDSSIHPFHIHVNPFQVLEVFDPNAATQAQLQAPYNWRDTIAIPASKTVGTVITPGRVKIRSRYVDFPGTFVLHCHILDHEDRGMMQEVQILDPAAKTAPPVPMHH
jgi:FtsP/CotA-like multicopper oxidase with cupredoxin domain